MKPRTVRRLCLVDGMNLDHIEGWLESMAARGLHYDHSDAFLFHFRRGEPAAVRYRLEPRGTLDCPEGMEHCRTLGCILIFQQVNEHFPLKKDRVQLL